MNRKPGCGIFLIAGAAFFAFCSLLQAQSDQKKSGTQENTDAGIRFRLQATGKEVGLSIYPGAKPHPESKGDSPAANFGLWGKSFGLKLVVLKLESKDAPAKVTAFYQKELAKYGKVLDCSQNETKPDAKSSGKQSSALTCEDEKPENGGMLLKSGTKGKQHIVNIEPDGQGSVFQLILVDTRGLDSDEHPL